MMLTALNLQSPCWTLTVLVLVVEVSQQQRFIAAVFPITAHFWEPLLKKPDTIPFFMLHMAANTRSLQENRTNQDSVVNTVWNKSSCRLE